MIIGISIDGVLRDSISKFKSSYEDIFELELPETLVFDLTAESLTANSLFKTPIDSYLFLYEEASLEIFGHAKESYRSVMVDLNELESKYKNDHTILLISQEIGNSIPATLFFLSKTSCKVHNYKFVNKNSEIWDHCDMMITSNSDILSSKPENKHTVKILSATNRNIESDYELPTLKDVLIFKVIDKISKNDIIPLTNTSNYDDE